MPNLTAALDWFTREAGCLSSLSVAYGDPKSCRSLIAGLARERTRLDEKSVDAPVRLDTLFDLASLTKLFTAISVMQLQEAGRLNLDGPMGDYAPQFVHLRPIPVRDILSYQVSLRTPERIDRQADPDRGLAALFQAAPSRHTSGRMYSDIHAMALKYVVEGAGRERFFDYVRKSILSPAGMEDTWAAVPLSALQRTACFNFEHRIENGRCTVRTDAPAGVVHDPKARGIGRGGADLCGHAGLFSTLPDMVRLCQALLNERLITKKSLMEMGADRTGRLFPGGHCQRLGYLCFTKHPVQRNSEVPEHMSGHTAAFSGFTGHHLSVDPVTGVFEVFLGNRCQNRLTVCLPAEDRAGWGLNPDGTGQVLWPDGRRVRSSVDYIYQKDLRLHSLIRKELGL